MSNGQLPNFNNLKNLCWCVLLSDMTFYARKIKVKTNLDVGEILRAILSLHLVLEVLL